jgi:ParB family chromosome partitioning protein
MSSQGNPQYIDLSQINPPAFPRYHDPAKLESIMTAMKRDGQLQEAVVIPTSDGRFDLLAGERRWIAAQKLGWAQLLCQVREGLSEFDKLRITYEENEEREPAGPVHQGQVFKAMLKAENCGPEELAVKLGMSRTNIFDYLALAGLEPDLQQAFEAKGLSVRQIKELNRLPDKAQKLSMAEECASQDLSGQTLKTRVDQKLGPQKLKAAKAPKTKKEPVPLPAGSGNEDMVTDGAKIWIKEPFDPAEETVDDYVEWVAEGLQAFLIYNTCATCSSLIKTGERHRDCGFIEYLRLQRAMLEALVNSAKATMEQTLVYEALGDKIANEEASRQCGVRSGDGKPWNSPWPDPLPGAAENSKALENIIHYGTANPPQ